MKHILELIIKKLKRKKTINPKQNKKNDTSISPPLSPKTKNKNIQEKYQANKSQNNNTFLELDYLNFSRIDIGLRKLNSSFDEFNFLMKIIMIIMRIPMKI